ncbi:MAG TPA: GAF domain-containing protein [Candidatus Bathyarchaeota archaeon]|nr:GAF domain-containing protein [Candidatus Bathyarchaeota archaeon]
MSEKTPNSVALKQVLTQILEEICTLSDCQSVAIRLYNNGDYPYYVHVGFPDFFIMKENSVCARDEEGNPILDEDDNPILECMCGNVLKGRFDPERPYFTEKGSFWTNSTTQLLRSITEKERLGRTRNMCNYSGYESVALIPMRLRNKTLGLIQMNDPRENMFTPKMIKNCELIANHAGAVVVNALEIQERMKDIFCLLNNLKRDKI